MKKDTAEIVALLDNIRSLHNVGSFFRTADGAGIRKLYLCGQTGYPPREEISKVALGAETVVPWEYHINAAECAKQLKERGYTLVALEQTPRSIPLSEFRPEKPICLVLGHEIDGVSDEMLDHCDIALEIPMKGQKKSLNVSVAFGIAVYALKNHL